jgi:hypothetical protein
MYVVRRRASKALSEMNLTKQFVPYHKRLEAFVLVYVALCMPAVEASVVALERIRLLQCF